MKLNAFVVVALCSAALIGCGRSESPIIEDPSGAELHLPSLRLTDLPKPVQDAVNAQAPGSQIADIDKETRNGQVIYEIRFRGGVPGTKLHIAEDGSIVSSDLSSVSIGEGSGASTSSSGAANLLNATPRDAETR